MDQMTILKLMFESPDKVWSWEWLAGFQAEAVSAYLRGISTSAQLAATHFAIERLVGEYHYMRAQLESEEEVVEALRRHANSAPIHGDGGSGVGQPPLPG